MGLIFGIVKFVVGAAIGATVGAGVTTLIVTRDGGETVTRLRGVVTDAIEGGKTAAREEEARQQQRYVELVNEEARERADAQRKADKDKDKKKKDDKDK